MNSEETVAVDLQNRTQWHRREQGEGEWGRGVGPWSAFSVSQSPGASPEILFLAKDLLCHLDARSGAWIREPWLLWHATNSVMNQPDWEFTKDRQADFGSAKDPFTAYGSAILVDVDNDGREEMIIGGCFGGFGVLRDDYSIVWWMQTPFTDMMLRLPGHRRCARRRTSLARHLPVERGLPLSRRSDRHGNSGASICKARPRILSAAISTAMERKSSSSGQRTAASLPSGPMRAGQGVIRWSLPIGCALGSPVVADVDGDGLFRDPRV